MKNFKLLLMVIFLILIGGCATTENYEAKLNSWVGNDINNLIASWGYPVSTFKMPNGNMVYGYSSKRIYITPITYNTRSNYNSYYGGNIQGNATTYTTGGQTYYFWCKTFFEVNSSQKIVKWRWEGNNCKSY